MIARCSFATALVAVQIGRAIQREGWNGKGLMVRLQKPDRLSKMSLPYLYLEYPPGEAYPAGARVPWAPTQTDMLADDWLVLEELQYNPSLSDELRKQTALRAEMSDAELRARLDGKWPPADTGGAQIESLTRTEPAKHSETVRAGQFDASADGVRLGPPTPRESETAYDRDAPLNDRWKASGGGATDALGNRLRPLNEAETRALADDDGEGGDDDGGLGVRRQSY